MVRVFRQVDWWNKAFLITLLIAPLTVWISILMMGMSLEWKRLRELQAANNASQLRDHSNRRQEQLHLSADTHCPTQPTDATHTHTLSHGRPAHTHTHSGTSCTHTHTHKDLAVTGVNNWWTSRNRDTVTQTIFIHKCTCTAKSAQKAWLYH